MPSSLPFPDHRALRTEPAGWQRLLQRLAATRTGSALLAPIAHRIDATVLRLTHGRTTLASLLTGLPVVTLTTVGARSGMPRSVPLVAIPMEEDGPETGSEARGAHPKARGKVILIASNFGGKQHPAWYYNLKANPHASLSIGEYKGEYLAHEATGEEREACWERAAFLYGGYNAYRLRAGHRTIGVFVLTPYEGG